MNVVGHARLLGVVALTVGVSTAFVLVILQAPRWSRAIVFFPIWIAGLGLIQAREKTCIALAASGKCNMDAGDESLLEYLAAANLLDANSRIEVDVLKAPHHGAHNSYSPEFVDRVRAQHIVFCGDGEHHNPEPDVVAGYLKAVKARPLSGARPTHFWFNWSHARAKAHLALWQEIEAMFTPAALGGAAVVRHSLGVGDKSLVVTS